MYRLPVFCSFMQLFEFSTLHGEAGQRWFLGGRWHKLLKSENFYKRVTPLTQPVTHPTMTHQVIPPLQGEDRVHEWSCRNNACAKRFLPLISLTMAGSSLGGDKCPGKSELGVLAQKNVCPDLFLHARSAVH